MASKYKRTNRYSNPGKNFAPIDFYESRMKIKLCLNKIAFFTVKNVTCQATYFTTLYLCVFNFRVKLWRKEGNI